MTVPLIAGNWKMFKSPAESRILSQQILDGCRDVHDRVVVLCPPFTSLSEVGQVIKGSRISLGGQNMAEVKSGAYTGEISGIFLKELGCRYVIIGHSERRTLYLEGDELINKKLRLALELGLVPIFCIGETLDQREGKKTFDVIRRQLVGGLRELKWNEDKVVVAYEPVWAIGTGRNATPDQAAEIHQYIRGEIRQEFGLEADRVRILYGGSVKPDNIDELMRQKEINGALVGGASLKAEDFLRIIRFKK